MKRKFRRDINNATSPTDNGPRHEWSADEKEAAKELEKVCNRRGRMARGELAHRQAGARLARAMLMNGSKAHVGKLDQRYMQSFYTMLDANRGNGHG